MGGGGVGELKQLCWFNVKPCLYFLVLFFFKASVVCVCFDRGRRTCMIVALQREGGGNRRRADEAIRV